MKINNLNSNNLFLKKNLNTDYLNLNNFVVLNKNSWTNLIIRSNNKKNL
jgi:hypothetical protein